MPIDSDQMGHVLDLDPSHIEKYFKSESEKWTPRTLDFSNSFNKKVKDQVYSLFNNLFHNSDKDSADDTNTYRLGLKLGNFSGEYGYTMFDQKYIDLSIGYCLLAANLIADGFSLKLCTALTLLHASHWQFADLIDIGRKSNSLDIEEHKVYSCAVTLCYLAVTKQCNFNELQQKAYDAFPDYKINNKKRSETPAAYGSNSPPEKSTKDDKNPPQTNDTIEALDKIINGLRDLIYMFADTTTSDSQKYNKIRQIISDSLYKKADSTFVTDVAKKCFGATYVMQQFDQYMKTMFSSFTGEPAVTVSSRFHSQYVSAINSFINKMDLTSSSLIKDWKENRAYSAGCIPYMNVKYLFDQTRKMEPLTTFLDVLKHVKTEKRGSINNVERTANILFGAYNDIYSCLKDIVEDTANLVFCIYNVLDEPHELNAAVHYIKKSWNETKEGPSCSNGTSSETTSTSSESTLKSSASSRELSGIHSSSVSIVKDIKNYSGESSLNKLRIQLKFLLALSYALESTRGLRNTVKDITQFNELMGQSPTKNKELGKDKENLNSFKETVKYVVEQEAYACASYYHFTYRYKDEVELLTLLFQYEKLLKTESFHDDSMSEGSTSSFSSSDTQSTSGPISLSSTIKSLLSKVEPEDESSILKVTSLEDLTNSLLSSLQVSDNESSTNEALSELLNCLDTKFNELSDKLTPSKK